MEYDGRGLPVRQWNPVPGFNSGAFTPLTELSSNYTACDIGDGITDFTDTRYSREPQPRVLEVRQAGESWHASQGVIYEYYGNEPTGELSCVRWHINSGGILERIGNYPCGELRVTKTTDEDGRVILRFVNRKGEAILERRIISGTTYADTYYVYDIYGNLRYILPPKASAEMTTDGEYSHEHTTLKGLCYSYGYDYRNRVQTKRLPGCRYTEYAYDCTDRLIGQYSPLMIADGIKQFTIYDNEGRVVYETYGTSTNTLTQMNTQLQDKRVVSGYEGENGLYYGYTIPEALSSWITISKQDVKIVNYYDNYDFLTLPDYAFCADSLQYEADANYGERYVNTLNPTISTSSRLTGSVTKTSGGEVMLTVYYYDSHGNIIQTCSTNHMGGYDRYKRLYSYDNLLMATHHNHSTSDTTYQIRNTYTYDNIGRLISETMQINNRKEIILQTNRYDAVGRLSAQQLPLGGNIQYSYNQRGWITDINSLHFDQTLYYDVQPNGESGYLNGNLSAQEFSISEGEGTMLSPSSYLSGEYRYGYDGMDRLRSAAYTETVRTDNNGESVSAGTHIYSDPSYTTQYGYDLNSNPTVIIRYGMQCTDMEQEEGASPRYIHRYSKTDHLLMTYEGNRLVKVTDRGADCTYEGATDFVDGSAATIEYAYDANGNMTRDLNKRISLITYDYHNLPDFVRFTDDHLIWYDYDSMGNRLSTTYGTLTNGVFTPEIGSLNPDEDENPYIENLYFDLRRDYCGEFIYEDGELERILTSNGYYKNGKYYFYIKDWQGNNRLTVGGLSDAIQTGGIIINPTVQTSVAKDAHVYYPYGMRFADVFEGTADRFQYGGKEIDRFSGLDLHDFSARWYDSQLCRFTTPDPLQEKYPHLSPYLYCAANPLRYTDPTGKDYYNINKMGTITLFKKTDDLSDRLLAEDGSYIDVDKFFIVSNQNERVRSDSSNYGYQSVDVDIYITKNGKTIYDFLIANTNVEWSKVTTRDSEGNVLEYIGTSHSENTDISIDYIFSTMLDENSVITQTIHNHSFGNSVVSQGDIDVATKIQNRFPNARFYIVFPNDSMPPKEYDMYSDPGMLDEFIITVIKEL